jgi:DnaJ-class molecular chaperone
LEELYNGGVKRLKYTRRIINVDGRTTSEREELRDVEIFPGYQNNSILKYPGFGNEAPGIVNCKLLLNPADLIVKIKQKNHKNYKRNNNDLIYTHRISLVDALNSEPVTFMTLDGRTLTVAMDEIISYRFVK